MKARELYETLRSNGVDFYCGVPDSLLKDFCAYIYDELGEHEHIIAANEGNAIALATGHYLATGNPGLVYMQNSGIGNAINPLLSLADPEVYSIPMVLLIGWRGEPGIKDAPQHVKQGRVQIALLESLELPFTIIDKDTADIDSIVTESVRLAKHKSAPVAIVVKKGSFEKYKLRKEIACTETRMSREEALGIILENTEEGIIISTTGKTSREVYEIRTQRKEEHRDFLTVGSMGHASSIALSVALSKKESKVYCLDGDGALLMHLGALAIAGQKAPSNYIHILLNNSCHESVGGQPTAADSIDMGKLCLACGYRHFHKAFDSVSLKDSIQKAKTEDGPVFIEIVIRAGARDNLGRPAESPVENKKIFMEHVRNN